MVTAIILSFQMSEAVWLTPSSYDVVLLLSIAPQSKYKGQCHVRCVNYSDNILYTCSGHAQLK